MGLFGGKGQAKAEGTATAAAAAAAPAAAAAAQSTGCCGGLSEDDKMGMLPDNRRKCRDIFCCSVFGLFWLGMIIIGAIGLKYGKWQRLVFGTDYEGMVCGSDAGLTDKKYITYPRTNEDFIANLGKKNPLDYKFYGICVSSCPGALDIVCNYPIDKNVLYTDTVKRTCLIDSNYVGPAGTPCSTVRSNCWISPQRTSSIMFRCIPDYNVTNSESAYCSYPPDVTSAYDPRCIVLTETTNGAVSKPAKPNMLFDQLNSGRQLWGRWFGDLGRAWWVILLVAVGLALLLGFVWVTFLKYFTGCMVWTTIFLSVTILSFLTGYFYYKAGLVTIELPPSINDKVAAVAAKGSAAVATATAYVPQSWKESADQYKVSYSAIAYISTAVLIVVLCIVVAMRNAIRVSIEVIKIGSDALRAMPLLTIFPCTNILSIGLFLIWWVFVAASLTSAGEVTTADLAKDVEDGLVLISKEYGVNASAALAQTLGQASNGTFTAIQDMPVMNYLMIYHIFGLLWTAQFLQGIASMTVAGSVCAWYFSQLPKELENNPDYEKRRYVGSKWRIGSALLRTVRYYLGTVAFGGFLIATIQMVRVVVAYMQRKLEPAAKNNAQLRFMLCCIQCCLKCLQKAIEVVTRNAYIFAALKGDGFCASGGRVFGLIRKHGSVFMIANVLGEVIMFLGKVTIAAVCGWGAYVLLDTMPEFARGGKWELSSTWLPILVTIFFAYVTASGFMMIFDLTVDAVLVCYCTDLDENGVALHFDGKKLDAKGRVKAAEEQAKAQREAKKAAQGNPLAGAAPKV